MPKDEEEWMRKYPHIKDFDLNVAEAKGWLSKHWYKAHSAEQRPRDFLDWWLGGEWLNLSENGYKEPEKIYNPKQLINFIEQYFINGNLIERVTRGKRDGYSDSLATKHYEKALGYAVKLREEVPDFPQTPDATGKPHLDLRRLQEWCIECEKNIYDLYGVLKRDRLEKALSLVQELRELLKSETPPIDETKWSKIRDGVWNEIERLIKAISDSGKTTENWHDRAIFGQDCGPLLGKMTEYKIHVPEDTNELAKMITAAEWMAKVDWDKVKTIVEEHQSGKAPTSTLNEQIEQMPLLRTAQIAEQKIYELVWKIYCLENQDFAEAVNKRHEHILTLFNDAANVLNSDKNLLKIAYLRDEKLNSDFKRLGDSLFGTSLQKPDNDNILQKIIDELKAIRDDAAKHGENISLVETEQKPQAKTQEWSEVSLDIIDDETVRYKIGKDNWQRANYAELGFKNKLNGLPNKLWGIFKKLAENCKNQVIECRTPKNISKDIDRICRTLKVFFGPQDRPILYNKKNKIWNIAFRLTFKSQDSKDS